MKVMIPFAFAHHFFSWPLKSLKLKKTQHIFNRVIKKFYNNFKILFFVIASKLSQKKSF